MIATRSPLGRLEPARRLRRAAAPPSPRRRRRRCGTWTAQRVEHGRRRARLDAVPLAGEALQGADRDRSVGADEAAVGIDARHVAAAAGRLARRAADAAADRGQRVRPAGDQVGLFEVARGDGAHVAARVGVHRAGDLAGDQLPMVALAGHLDVDRRHERRRLHWYVSRLRRQCRARPRWARSWAASRIRIQQNGRRGPPRFPKAREPSSARGASGARASDVPSATERTFLESDAFSRRPNGRASSASPRGGALGSPRAVRLRGFRRGRSCRSAGPW